MHEIRFFEGRELPNYYAIEGKIVSFETDFRVWLKHARLLEDPGLGDDERLALCVDNAISPVGGGVSAEGLMLAMSWFFTCGDSERLMTVKPHERVLKGKAELPVVTSAYWDFWHIWASFRQQYDIDLYRCGELHWWEFKWRLDALKGDTPYVNIGRMRGLKKSDVVQGSEKAVKAQQNRTWGEVLLEKKYYALPGQGVVE